MSAGPLSYPGRCLRKLKSAKRWWIPIALLTVVLVNLAGALMPRIYLSQAVVRVHEPKGFMAPGAAGAALPIGDRLRIIREEVTSLNFLTQIAHREKFDEAIPPGTAEYALLLQKMSDAIGLEARAQDAFEISYRAETPEKARRLTRAIIEQYVQNINWEYEKQTRKSEAIIKSQLDDGRQKFESAQSDILKFKNNHLSEIPEAQPEHVRQLSELRTQQQSDTNQINALRDSIAQAKLKLGNADQEAAAEAAVPAESKEIQQLLKEKKDLELMMNTLLQNFTPKHWKVKQVQTQLLRVKEQIKLAQTSQAHQTAKAQGKFRQGIEESIAQYKREEARLVEQIANTARQAQTHEQCLANIPRNQVELDRLEGVRRRAEEQMSAIAQKMDEARLASATGRQELGPTFEVMTPPSLPPVPVFPKRGHVIQGGILLGLLAGAAVIGFLAILDSSLHSMEEARRAVQMPLLGVVQRIVTHAEEERRARSRRQKIIGLGAGLTLLIFAAIAGYLHYHESFKHSFENALNLINRW